MYVLSLSFLPFLCFSTLLTCSLVPAILYPQSILFTYPLYFLSGSSTASVQLQSHFSICPSIHGYSSNPISSPLPRAPPSLGSLPSPSFITSKKLKRSDTNKIPGIKKRNHKLLDYDALRAKVKKLVEKPDKDVTKLPRAEKEAEQARAAYEQLNAQLHTELPQLIDLRVPYLDPSFEALVKIQLRFCAEAYSRMAQVQQHMDPETREEYASGQLDTKVEQILQEIRDLSISGMT